MNNNVIKNRIIALSGEPVSGKGTTVKFLIKKLKEQGYSDDQIHLITTGNEFRKYFNSIVDLIRSLKDTEKLKEISKREELEEFFSNQEYRKILTETILKLQGMDLSNFTIQQANNSKEFKTVRRVVDSLIDNGIKEKGIEINEASHPDEIWIIDSRLAFHNIPESFSIRLTTDPNVAGERLFNDKSRGKEDSEYESIEQAKEEREERRKGEQERYKKRYGIDLEDENNYDLMIDTSYSSPSDIAEVILQCERCYREDKEFPKKWTSLEIFKKVTNPLGDEELR